MAVYVDPNFEWPKTKAWPFGSVSHMYADTPSELHAFAARLGLKRKWCSDHTQPNSKLLHYDLSPKKREQAVRMGAVEVDQRHKVQFYPAHIRRWMEEDDDGGEAQREQPADSGRSVHRPRGQDSRRDVRPRVDGEPRLF